MRAGIVSTKDDGAGAGPDVTFLPDRGDLASTVNSLETGGLIAKPQIGPAHESESKAIVNLRDADSVLRLNLPQQLEVVQLLDLAGEYLHLDYMYEPDKMRGQAVTLKLHGKLQGEVRVKDLYLLLESVLKFKGFAMTCHEGNLVTIVPAAEALQANPDLIDVADKAINPGDMVVTGVFDLRHISVSAATTLLQAMKLSLAVTPVEASQTLIVTCYAHQIDRIERLLYVIDKAGSPKEFRFRQIRYTAAGSLLRKVQELIKQMGDVPVADTAAAKSAGASIRASAKPTVSRNNSVGRGDDAPYLDADERTNRLMMIGCAEQLTVVDRLVDALDVAQQDLRILMVYDIEHVEAAEVAKKLQELQIIDAGPRPRTAYAETGKIAGAETAVDMAAERPVLVVLEAANTLIVNATEEQHARIEAVLDYLDAEVRAETIPYEIYFLESQDPENLAQVLEKIVHETVQDKEGKLQKILRNTDDQIIIVPDKETFSLIIYASRKNQEWISKLIKTLDRRRPQVLIDVTLVEIRKTDDFNYDLNLITSIPDLMETGGQTGSFAAGSQRIVDKLLEPGMRGQFADFQSNSGTATGFYADIHINALLRAVQKKNYGRVLAKPKVLVNDNEKGVIKTTDTTYVTKKSSIPVTNGTAGQQNTLIETAVAYEPYDAGITLEITPHISEGELLRLEINLTRSDFGVITGEKPPDQTSSDVNTVVTVPNQSTIILGGLLRLNQTKGGNKVPLLGDIPILGGAFRSIASSDIQSKLYVFVKAEIIRPAGAAANGYQDLSRISEQSRKAFQQYEHEFQRYETWPGIKPNLVPPARVLDTR
jgi:type II secretory pathway component GspD/PulD (secretin)